MRYFYILFLSLAIGLSAAHLHAQDADQRMAGEAQEDPYKYLKLFGDVFERVKVLYVDEVTDEELVEHAINGMLTGLDPHSAFLNDDGYDDMKVQTRGSFGGLGIEVTMENGFVKVVSPIDDTPAYEAGVQAGDMITHLDGKPVMGLSLSEAVDKMRGKVGTTIELTIRREDVADAVKIKVKRDIIKIRSVRHRIEGDIGYIRVTTFNQQTTPGVHSAINEIKEELGD
jgi:carboxyl-terminal processing protease